MADTVKVGCRLPQGIRLRVYEWGKDGFGDPQLREVGAIELAGSGGHLAAPGGMHGKDDITYSDVSADLWKAWLDDNKDSDLVKSGAVFKDGQDPLDQKEDEGKEPAAKPATRRRAS